MIMVMIMRIVIVIITIIIRDDNLFILCPLLSII